MKLARGWDEPNSSHLGSGKHVVIAEAESPAIQGLTRGKSLLLYHYRHLKRSHTLKRVKL